ncbi:MAG: MerR family transcriptional regulator, partial [Spirochaetaceae bacterium]|nr:MerR family transcriptional regulator [Spirochaetaceae bacterium]
MEYKGLTIGELAGRTGVGVEALRFYERKGLLPSPTRDASGYRRYREDDVVRVRFIRRAKELGFTLAEIHELLELRATDEKTCEEVRTIARDKITDLDQRIR